MQKVQIVGIIVRGGRNRELSVSVFSKYVFENGAGLGERDTTLLNDRGRLGGVPIWFSSALTDAGIMCTVPVVQEDS